MIDFSTEFGQRAHKRLSEEEILWLTTIDAQGIPQPRPVWFLWDGETFLVFSQSQAHKVAHIQNRNQVALNLNSTFTGGDVVVLLGEAQMLSTPVSQPEMDAYLKKYEQGLKGINMTESDFQDSYHTAIRIKPTQLRGH
jgi:PPOX class probable F420-dependent enzyme